MTQCVVHEIGLKCPGCGVVAQQDFMVWYGERVLRCIPCILKNRAYKRWELANPRRILLNGMVFLQDAFATARNGRVIIGEGDGDD